MICLGILVISEEEKIIVVAKNIELMNFIRYFLNFRSNELNIQQCIKNEVTR